MSEDRAPYIPTQPPGVLVSRLIALSTQFDASLGDLSRATRENALFIHSLAVKCDQDGRTLESFTIAELLELASEPPAASNQQR